MTKQELLQTPQYLDYLDIMKIYKCGRDKALGIIKGIKNVSDRAKIKGKVTISDYEDWFASINKNWLDNLKKEAN